MKKLMYISVLSFIKRYFISFFLKLTLVFTLVVSGNFYAYASEKISPLPTTIQDQNISLKKFKLGLEYMTADELFVEADGWLKILHDSAKDVYQKKMIIEDINIKDEKRSNQLALTELRKLRNDKAKKLNTILKELNQRIGLDKEGKELEKVLPYRRYLESVTGMSEEITDPKSFMTSVLTWVFSSDGGVLWLINFFKFIAIVFLAYVIGKLTRKSIIKAFSISPHSSHLLKNFIVNTIEKIIIFIGVLMALSLLGVNMGPVLALVGAAGFVVAFALQNTLSNFASGLMILTYRPFDIDDIVDVAGVMGRVKSMTLVTTSIMTADNRMIIVPNNTIWGSTITNVTYSDKRRVDMTCAISYNENIDKAQKVLKDVLSKHPLILKDPKPTVQVHELADSSVNFIVRPWTLTADYWTVYWEITRRIKIRFDEEGINIPFPQRDIHIVSSTETQSAVQKKQDFTKTKANELDVTQMESGNEDDN